MNTNKSDKCPICEHERDMPKHMLERALFRALTVELKNRIRAERTESFNARRKLARAEYEKWRIDNPLSEIPLKDDDDDIKSAQQEYRKLKSIHEAGLCVERTKN